MRRMPVAATAVVALAVAAMIALGVWQLHRRTEKHAFIAQVSANPARAPVAFPVAPDDRLLFRRTAATCTRVTAMTRAGAGKAGFRQIATCATAVGSIRVQLGTTHDPMHLARWTGGRVSGWISHAPDARPLIAGWFAPRAQEMLLVSDRPLAGLQANTQPDASLVPDNHLAYAVQWFLFAGVAAIIYVVALRRRGAKVAPTPRAR